MAASSGLTYEKDDRIPPRARILAVAGDLFYRHGIRAVGVDAIADAHHYTTTKSQPVDKSNAFSISDADAAGTR